MLLFSMTAPKKFCRWCQQVLFFGTNRVVVMRFKPWFKPSLALDILWLRVSWKPAGVSWAKGSTVAACVSS